MTKEKGTTGQVLDPEGVYHPKHYNVHPSGVEVIDLIRDLQCDLANAVKYLLRAEHKGDQKKDLQKAMWYLTDQGKCSRPQFFALTYDAEKWQRVIVAEPNPIVSRVLRLILEYHAFGRWDALQEAVSGLEQHYYKLFPPQAVEEPAEMK